jgi:type IV secretory pathway VirB10-like protein
MSSRLMDRNMNIQPTITIRPGQRFNIFVEKDIVFPAPYPSTVVSLDLESDSKTKPE